MATASTIITPLLQALLLSADATLVVRCITTIIRTDAAVTAVVDCIECIFVFLDSALQQDAVIHKLLELLKVNVACTHTNTPNSKHSSMQSSRPVSNMVSMHQRVLNVQYYLIL